MEFWRTSDLAAVLGVSRRMLGRMADQDLLPERITLHDSINGWRACKIRDWLAAGCPERHRWTWSPALLPRLDELIKRRHRELRSLNDGIQERQQWLENHTPGPDRIRGKTGNSNDAVRPEAFPPAGSAARGPGNAGNANAGKSMKTRAVPHSVTAASHLRIGPHSSKPGKLDTVARYN